MSAAELDAAVLAWVAEVTGGTVADHHLLTAGGRLGYAVDVVLPTGPVALFLQRDRPGITTTSSFLPFDREAEVYAAVASTGVPVPRVWGVSLEHNALLVDRVEGAVWFRAPSDPAEAEAVAVDFVAQLARWHAVPASELPLPGFAPVGTVAEHQRAVVAELRREFEAEDARHPIDPLGWALLEVLEERLPDVDVAPVLVQGDTGPGNFLHAGGRVTAVIDWELAHVGDPMDDIAWLSWRATQHGFPDLPARMREYEAASGHVVDPARVAYYRVNALARLGPRFGVPDMGGRTLVPGAPAGAADAAFDRNADGSQVVLSMLHRRMRLTALADALGHELGPRSVPEEDDDPAHAPLYDLVLDQLQGIVGRVEDRGAAALAKAAARHVKHLKELDRNARRFADRERDDIAGLLGRPSTGSVDDDRRALVAAVRAGAVGRLDYLDYHWRRLVHEDHLLRTASGALYERSWPPVR